jgi:16S rRNA (guanine527-N7)-methyltransferase
MVKKPAPLSDHDLLASGASMLGLSLCREKTAQLLKYCDFLLFWNDIAGLTSYRKKRDLLIYMFLDSLSFVPILQRFSPCHALDLGTGGGFPLFPCAIVSSPVEATLLDSSSKKTEFLQHLVKKLHLSGIEVITQRVEDLGLLHRDRYDIVCSRAYASLPRFIADALPLIKKGGSLCAWKGPRFEEELREASQIMEKEGIELEELYHYDLPFANRKSVIVIMKKNM